VKTENKAELIAVVGVVLMGVGLNVDGGEMLVTAAAFTFLWSGLVGMFGRGEK